LVHSRGGGIKGRWAWLSGHPCGHPKVDTAFPSLASKNVAPGYVVALNLQGDPAWHWPCEWDGEEYALEYVCPIEAPRQTKP